MQVDQASGYSGPDRRRPVTTVDLKSYLLRAIVIGILLVSAWCLLVALSRHQPPETRRALIGLSRTMVAGSLLAAAALRFAAWRITGTARAAWSVIIFAVAGAAIPVVGMISRLPGAQSAITDQTTIARGMVLLALIGLAAMLLVSPVVVSRLRPLRTTAPFLVGCLAAAVVITVRGPVGGTTPLLSTTATVMRWLLAALGFALATAFVVLGTVRARRGDRLIGYALVPLVAASLARAILGPLPYQQMVLPAASQLFVAVLLAAGSALALWQLQTGRGSRLLAVAGELQGTKLSLAEVERDHARAVHDARTAIVAVSGAARMLARPESSPGIDPERLHQLVTAELRRLGSLMDREVHSADRSFQPAAVIEPLVLAHKLAGAKIETAIGDCAAVGRPEATATAVANVLSNARVHAPGARIWVSVTAADDSVRIVIADDGPGIRPEERPLVVQRGVQGSSAGGHGSGIGLAAAAQAMSDQGGTLSVGGRPGGGTVITLTLRRDRRRPAEELPALPRQRRAADGLERLRHGHTGRPVRAVHGRIGPEC